MEEQKSAGAKEEYERQLFEIHALGQGDEYEKALKMLADLRRQYSTQDRDGWLERSIRADEALILSTHGRLREALDVYRSISALVEIGSMDFVENQMAMARVLEKESALETAAVELKKALDFSAGIPGTRVLDLLAAYAGILSQKKEELPSCYGTVFQRAVSSWGMKADGDSVSGTTSLVKSALLAARQKRDAERRYRRLLQEIRELEQSERLARICLYIEQETVGYFCDLARMQIGDKEWETISKDQ